MTQDGRTAPRTALAFGITSIPYGMVGAFVATIMPLLTRKAGISVEDIGWFGTAAMVPTTLQFLYAPLVDIGPKRKHWLVLVAALGAACLCAALAMPLPKGATAFVAFTIAAQAISGLVGSCNGGILATTMPDELRGTASGYYNAGNLGGGALGVWAALWAVNAGVSTLVLDAIVFAVMVIPALAILAVDEPARERRTARVVFGTMARDVWAVAKSRQGWSGILLCASPVGTAALLNYFAAVSVDYHASDRMVAFVNGPLNGVLTAVGALVGGYACDRMNRRLAYLISGGLTAVCGIVMSFAPTAPMTYAIGVSVYLFIAGLCYSAFSATVLESIGKAGTNASTQYTLFTAAGNLAIGYVGWFDTRFHERHGVASLLRVDAGLNLVGILVLGAVFVLMAQRKRREDTLTAAA